MFKPVGNLIYKTPWWAMVCGGLLVLLVLVLFTLPIQVIRLHESGDTPQERRAIEREINLAFGDRALNLAENVVQAMRARTQDSARQQELEQALTEIARAKRELAQAEETEFGGNARQMARESTDQALNMAEEAAQTSVDAAVNAREALASSMASRALTAASTEVCAASSAMFKA